jgi:hypothetical protein
VEFYLDNNLVNTVNTAPYSFSTSSLAVGSHSVYAKAYDSNNQTATSSTATVTVQMVNTTVPSTDIPETGTAILIDGLEDEAWKSAIPQSPSKVIIPTISSASDLSGEIRTLWDNQYLYVFADVTDDVKIRDSGDNDPYNDDAVEVYIDFNNDKATTYSSDDVQYTFRWNDNTVHVNPSDRSTSNIQFVTVATSYGYILEARIPWTTLQGNPVTGQQMGVDFQINDDDDGGDRDGKLAWSASTDDAWQNPSLFGLGRLSGILSGIEEIVFGHMKVYPNPFQHTITLEGLSEQMSYSIVDVNGRTVQAGITSGVIDSPLPAGVYTLTLKSSQDLFYHLKMVKTL